MAEGGRDVKLLFVARREISISYGSVKEYSEVSKGFGVLGTASSDGTVDVAVYARPHVVDEETVAFIMANRLSHKNLQSNPHAAYLFREGTTGHAGKRLHRLSPGWASKATVPPPRPPPERSTHGPLPRA